jgi:HK97 family phage major capsid protein
MTANQTFIQKADMVVADLINEGGYLLPEQSKQFFEIAITESNLLPRLTVKPMSSPSMELSKVGFSGRVLRGAVESRALSEADRARPDFGKVTLNTQELVGEIHIPYAAVEDNILQNTFVNFITQLMAKAVARDIEELIITGDTSSADSYLRLLNGFLKQTTSHAIDAGGARLNKGILKQMIQAMPSLYWRGSRNFMFLTSKNAMIDYHDSLTSRQTLIGDKALTTDVRSASDEYAGIPVIDVPVYPENLGTTTDETNVVLVDPKNMAVGMQRDIKVETAKDISARVYITVVSVRLDAKYIHEPATVKATHVLASAGN